MFRYFAWIHVTLISAFAHPPIPTPPASLALSLFRKHYALFLPPYFVERDLKKRKEEKKMKILLLHTLLQLWQVPYGTSFQKFQKDIIID